MPAHHNCGTVAILAHAAPAFIAPDLWLPTIPADTMDYKVGGMMQESVYCVPILHITC